MLRKKICALALVAIIAAAMITAASAASDSYLILKDKGFYHGSLQYVVDSGPFIGKTVSESLSLQASMSYKLAEAGEYTVEPTVIAIVEAPNGMEIGLQLNNWAPVTVNGNEWATYSYTWEANLEMEAFWREGGEGTFLAVPGGSILKSLCLVLIEPNPYMVTIPAEVDLFVTDVSFTVNGTLVLNENFGSGKTLSASWTQAYPEWPQTDYEIINTNDSGSGGGGSSTGGSASSGSSNPRTGDGTLIWAALGLFGTSGICLSTMRRATKKSK